MVINSLHRQCNCTAHTQVLLQHKAENHICSLRETLFLLGEFTRYKKLYVRDRMSQIGGFCLHLRLHLLYQLGNNACKCIFVFSAMIKKSVTMVSNCPGLVLPNGLQNGKSRFWRFHFAAFQLQLGLCEI